MKSKRKNNYLTDIIARGGYRRRAIISYNITYSITSYVRNYFLTFFIKIDVIKCYKKLPIKLPNVRYKMVYLKRKKCHIICPTNLYRRKKAYSRIKLNFDILLPKNNLCNPGVILAPKLGTVPTP